MRNIPFAAIACGVMLSTSVAFASDGNDCHVRVDTDRGKGGTQVKICKESASIGFSGPIKDVDWQHPLGGREAALPKAGRDIDKAKNAVGEAGQRVVQETNKVIRRIFGW